MDQFLNSNRRNYFSKAPRQVQGKEEEQKCAYFGSVGSNVPSVEACADDGYPFE